MPEFISENIHAVVFNLLAHPQLTIREHAAKTLATYITCSTVQVSHLHTVLTFHTGTNIRISHVKLLY